MKDILKNLKINFYLIYLIGVIGFIIPSVRPVMITLTAPVLLITGLYAVIKTCQDTPVDSRMKFLVWTASIFFVTIFLEILGVQYGIVFGQYDYGRVLGPGILGVPLIIGLNWVVVIMGATGIFNRLTDNKWLVSAGVAFSACAFDFVLEPAAITLDFWQWGGAIPVKNYVSWFIIALVFGFVSRIMKIKVSEKWTPDLLFAQFMFFIGIRIFMFLGIFN